MNTKRGRRDALAVLMSAALIALVWITGIFTKPQTWGSMEFYKLDFFEGTAQLRVEDGVQYGVQNTGPDLTLNRGVYLFKYWVDTDGECEIRFDSANGAAIEPGAIHIGPDSDMETIELNVLEDADYVNIILDFKSGTYMDVNEVRLYTQPLTDHTFTFAFFVAAACLLYLLWAHGVLTPERRGRLVIIGAAVLVVSAPMLKDNFTLGHDSLFHLARLENLVDGLRCGQFPVRAGGFTYNGYGAVTSAFYPDMVLYPFALMHLAGASLAYVMNVMSITVSIVTAATMYACAKRIYGDSNAATCASVLYVCASYRLDDLFMRHALGEVWALAFMPVFVLGLWEVFFGDKRRWRVLVAGAAAVLMSHILSTLICAMLAVGLGVCCLPKILREKRLDAVLKAIAATCLVGAFFLVPLVMYMRQGINADSIAACELGNTTIAPAQLFLMGSGELPVDPVDTTLMGHPTELGLPVVIGAMLALLWLVTAEKKRDGALRAAGILLAAGIIASVMATRLFPWPYVTLVTRLFDRLQFGWRLIGPACLLLSLAGGYGYSRLAPAHGAQVAAALTGFALLVVMPTINAQARFDEYLEPGEGAETQIAYREYNLPDTDIEDISDHAVLTDGGAACEKYEKNGTKITAQVAAEEEGTISFPLFGFDGYKATLNGVEIPWTLGENNRLTVSLAPGESGELRIWFAGKTAWRVADGVSLAAAIGLALTAGRRRKREAV